MIDMNLKNFKIKVFVFISSNLLSSRSKKADIQQLNVPKVNVAYVFTLVNRTGLILFFEI